MTSTEKFTVIVVTPEGQRIRLFPRTRKTSFFSSINVAVKALDKYSRRIPVNGWRGLIYKGPADCDATPIQYMAL